MEINSIKYAVVATITIGGEPKGSNLRIFPAFYGYTYVQHNTEEREEISEDISRGVTSYLRYSILVKSGLVMIRACRFEEDMAFLILFVLALQC